jgi:hypothetical protein
LVWRSHISMVVATVLVYVVAVLTMEVNYFRLAVYRS